MRADHLRRLPGHHRDRPGGTARDPQRRRAELDEGRRRLLGVGSPASRRRHDPAGRRRQVGRAARRRGRLLRAVRPRLPARGDGCRRRRGRRRGQGHRGRRRPGGGPARHRDRRGRPAHRSGSPPTTRTTSLKMEVTKGEEPGTDRRSPTSTRTSTCRRRPTTRSSTSRRWAADPDPTGSHRPLARPGRQRRERSQAKSARCSSGPPGVSTITGRRLRARARRSPRGRRGPRRSWRAGRRRSRRSRGCRWRARGRSGR